MSEMLYELGSTEEGKNNQNKYNIYSSNKDHISIEDFYRIMVKDWRKSKIDSYEIYLQQGNIPAGVLYNLLGLEPFQKPSDEDKKRLENIKDELQKEADKFLRVDIEKRDALVQAIGFLFAIMLNDKRHEALCEVLKKSTWSLLSTVITDKCSDGIVELNEMNDIYKMATELGLFAPSLKEETIKEINKQITDSKSKIENLNDAFKTYYKSYAEQNENNDLDNETNRNKLLTKFIELKKIENSIMDKPDLTDDEYNKQFDAFLEECEIKLIKPYEKFEKTYFNEFKKSHDLSLPLTSIDYSEIKKNFTSFGLTEEDWKTFEKDNNISIEETVSEREYKKLKADKEKAEKKALKSSKPGVLISRKIIKITAVALAVIIVLFELISLPRAIAITKDYADLGDSKNGIFRELLEYDHCGVLSSWIATNTIKWDWNENALRKAESYASLDDSKELIRQELKEYEYFEDSEIEYAMDNIEWDWNKNALEKAKRYVELDYTIEEISEELLEYDLFTESEVEYAMNNL